MSLRGESSGYVLAFGPAEFLDQREHQPLVLPEELAHLLAVLRLRGFGFGDRAGVQEVAVNLPVQIVAVRHDHEREIARLFAEDFAGVENHRETLARTLRVPEHAELALQFFALEERIVGAVHADKLVVLGDDLLVVLVVEDEVLDVIQQPAAGGTNPQSHPPGSCPFSAISSRSIFSFSSSARSQLKKCSHSAVMLPTFVSMAFDSTQKALVRKSCGMSFL